MERLAALLAAGVVLSLTVLPAAAADGRTPRVLWEVRDASRATRVAADRRRVIANAGAGQPARFPVAAWDERDGRLLWRDETPLADTTQAASVHDLIVGGGRVFAAGSLHTGDDPEEGEISWVVRAYDAATGRILWEDIHDDGTDRNWATAMVAGGGRLFVAGAAGFDWLVRVYDPRTGTLLWSDRWNNLDGRVGASAVAFHGGRLLVTGTLGGVRAYDAATGAVLWHARPAERRATAIAATGGRVFAVGSVVDPVGSSDLWVGAFDLATGRPLWESLTLGSSVSAQILDVVALGARVFVAGKTTEGPTVAALSAASGRTLWQDEASTGTALAVSRCEVIVSGTRGYEPQGGRILWERTAPELTVNDVALTRRGFATASSGPIQLQRFVDACARGPTRLAGGTSPGAIRRR